MGFFSFLLLIVLVCWIISLQGKIDRLSDTLRYVCKKINDYEKVSFTTPQVVPEKDVVDQSTTFEQQISEVEKEEKVIVQPKISEQDVEQPKTQPVFIESTPKEDFDLQKALLGNIFNKIGALAIIIAVIILIKLVSPFIVITPVMKFVSGILLGSGLLVAGSVIHKKENLKNYSEVLLGTGFATYFITTYCGATVLDLYGSITALIIGGVLLASTYMVSDKLKTASMIIVGLVGGYLTPVFAEASIEEIFGFIIFLNTLSLVFTLKNQKYKLLNTINLALSMLCMTNIYVFKVFLFKNEEVSYVYPLVLWGVYILYDLFRDKASLIDNISSWINYALLTVFSLLLFSNAHEKLGIAFVVTALIYLLLAGSSRVAQNLLYKTYEYFVLLNVWLYIVFILNDVQSVISWTVVALILSVLAATFKLYYLVPAVVGFYSTAFVGALIAQSGNEVCLIAKYAPIVNPRTFVFMIPVVCMMFSSMFLRGFAIRAANWVKFMGLSMGYIYAVGEVNSYLMRISEDDDFINFNRLMIFTIIGYIYSLNAKKIANLTQSLLFNFASYSIFSLATILLLCGSYWYPDAYLPIVNLRFAAYLLAIVACVMISRWDKVDFFKYVAVFLGFLLCHSESAGIPKLYGEGWQYLISLSWVLYSGIATIVGIVKNRRYLINAGIGIIILTIARIFIYDLAKVDALYKLVAFLALGIILMLVSYIYTVNKNKK